MKKLILTFVEVFTKIGKKARRFFNEKETTWFNSKCCKKLGKNPIKDYQ